LLEYYTQSDEKVKNLRNAAPDVFLKGTVGYSRLCSCDHQPIIVSDEDEAKDWKYKTFIDKKENEEKYRQIASFPPKKEETLFKFTCPTDERPYPYLVENNTEENSEKYPYVPCCAAEDTINNENSFYNNYFKPMQTDKKYDILFLGNLSYLPNQNAVQYLVEKIMPLLIQRKANIKVNIAGGSTLSENSRMNTPQINYSGWVKDSRVAYAETVLFVAPLFTGAGLQNKLLEAMSMGIPCIATSIANASLHAKPNEEIMIADDAVAFVDCIMYLLENEEKRRQLQVNAAKFIQDNYSWDSVNQKLLECI
jgi:glycosyltransferase involved in cell wall biosynthesis